MWPTWVHRNLKWFRLEWLSKEGDSSISLGVCFGSLPSSMWNILQLVTLSWLEWICVNSVIKDACIVLLKQTTLCRCTYEWFLWSVGPRWQPSTHTATHSPHPSSIGEKTRGTWARKLMGPNKDREITYQVPSQAKQTGCGELNCIYCPLA